MHALWRLDDIRHLRRSDFGDDSGDDGGVFVASTARAFVGAHLCGNRLFRYRDFGASMGQAGRRKQWRGASARVAGQSVGVRLGMLRGAVCGDRQTPHRRSLAQAHFSAYQLGGAGADSALLLLASTRLCVEQHRTADVGTLAVLRHRGEHAHHVALAHRANGDARQSGRCVHHRAAIGGMRDWRDFSGGKHHVVASLGLCLCGGGGRVDYGKWHEQALTRFFVRSWFDF